MNTLCVAIIARNSGATIGNCIRSLEKDVDDIVVVFAGESTDNTREEAQKASSKVRTYDFEWIDDFAAARNFSFSKLDTDWIMWVDADDEVLHAEKLKEISESLKEDEGCVWFPYQYAFDEFGNLTTLYERERLLRNKQGWIWKSRIHETVQPLIPCRYVRTDQVIIKHNHLSGVSRGERNFKILNIMLKESPEDKRIWLYMGHQNFAGGNYMEAAKWYLKFAEADVVPIEKYQALCYASKSLHEISDYDQSATIALHAIETHPQYIDAYVDLARAYLGARDYDRAIHWVKISDTKEIIKSPPPVIFVNPLDYTFNRGAILAECYLQKGELDTAIHYLTEINQIRPTFEAQIQHLNNLRTRQDIIRSIKLLALRLLDAHEIVKLKSLLNSVPFWFKDLPEYEELLAGVENYTKALTNDYKIKNGYVDISNVEDLQPVLNELDELLEKGTIKRATLVCGRPGKTRSMSLRDMEELVQTRPGRHVLNLRLTQKNVILQYDKKMPEFFLRLYCGQGLEPWNPKTIKEVGCGGSETSAAYVCKNWNAQSILYGMDTQVWDGVLYRTKFKPNTPPCNLFIVSRVPEILADDIPCDQKWLWFHDTDVQGRFTPNLAEKCNAIIALSQWHVNHLKRTYPFLKDCEVIDFDNNTLTYDDVYDHGIFYADSKLKRKPMIAIIGDGIDLSRFGEIPEKKPHSFMWSSSPDRGLEELLTMWPELKKGLPDATLKIYYGWDYYDKYLHFPGMREFKQKILSLVKQDGVEWCGRVGQSHLAQIMAETQAYVYPPHPFRETYGITFIECQRSKVLCFYRENGALGETIGDRGFVFKDVQNVIDTISIPQHNVLNRGYEYSLTRDWKSQVKKMQDLYWRLV